MKKFILFLSLFIIIGSGIYILISSYTFSDGVRKGFLMKFSKKGLIFKTHEGEVNLGYINTVGGKFAANTWQFSVKDNHTELIESLNLNEGEELQFYYKEKLKALPWQGDTKYFVYRVEKVKVPNQDGGKNY